MRKLILLSLFILCSCVGTSKTDLAAIHKIGVISATRDNVDVVFVGTTVFTNNVATINLPEANLDDSIEQSAGAFLQSKYQVFDLGQYRNEIISGYYNPNPEFMEGTFDYDRVMSALAKIGRDNGLDTVVFIHSRPGDFGAKNGHVLHTRNFFSSEGTMIMGDYTAYIINTNKGTYVATLDTYNTHGGPGERMLGINENDELSTIRPENVENLSPEQRNKLGLRLKQNINNLVPKLLSRLFEAKAF